MTYLGVEGSHWGVRLQCPVSIDSYDLLKRKVMNKEWSDSSCYLGAIPWHFNKLGYNKEGFTFLCSERWTIDWVNGIPPSLNIVQKILRRFDKKVHWNIKCWRSATKLVEQKGQKGLSLGLKRNRYGGSLEWLVRRRINLVTEERERHFRDAYQGRLGGGAR